jgi:acetyl esterase/lipase
MHNTTRVLLAAFAFAALTNFAAEPKEILLWPNGAPGSEGKTDKEVVAVSKSGEQSITSVHKPSITPYLPKEKGNGAAVLVIPGGGHRNLAITHEGYNVAETLSAHGIAAFMLKHRLARETNSTYKIDVHALADTQRAMRLIRSRADEWKVDPKRIGAMGFSAGGELVWLASDRFDEGKADATDLIERQPSRPSFQALIYPGRSADIQPKSKDYPPVFLACAYNDRPDIGEGLAEVYLRFKRAGVPTELHIYSSGGHGFGLRSTNKKPVGKWMDRFEEWLADSGFVNP